MARSPRLPLPAAVLVAWLAASFVAGYVGLFAQGAGPLTLLFIFGPPLAMLLLLAFSPRIQTFVALLDVRLLTLAQTVRVLGGVFLPLAAVGTLPAGFALPAGLGDMFIGISAPLVATLVVPKLSQT